MNHQKRIRLENAFRVMRKNKLIFVILILQCTVCITVSGLLTAMSSAANMNIVGAQDIFQKNFYYLLDRSYEDDSSEQYMDGPEQEFLNLNGFYQELLNQKRFLFTSVNEQSVSVKDTGVIPRKFYEYYETGDEEDPYPTEKGNFIRIKTVQLSPRAFEEFGIKTIDGRMFEPEDFVLSDSKPVPVLLGNEYQAVFNIGDTFAGMDIYENLIFEVIGFLAPDTTGPVGMSFDTLDRYVILPGFTEFGEISENVQYYKKVVLQQMVNGAIISDEPMEVEDYINGLRDKYHLPFQFIISQAGHESFAEALSLTQDTANALRLFLIAFFAFTAVCVSLVIISRLEENYFAYGVHLLSGAKKKDISAMTAWQIGIILFVSFLISVIVYMFIYPEDFLWVSLSLMNFYFAIFMFLIVYGVTAYRIRKIKIADLLRRTE